MKPALPLILAITLAGCVATQETSVSPAEVVLISDVQWTPLNPARGDASPQAGTLWGTRTGRGPSGFLVRFNDGFSSPPHIHNVQYRGVVISGLLHNADPNAENMWMPAGSYWTQPAGDAHITSAKGEYNMAYIEIGDGPYLVRPTDDAFATPDIAVNVDASNIVWLDASDIAWVEQPETSTSAGLEMAFLWGSPRSAQANGSMIKLRPESGAFIRSQGASFRGIVIQGDVNRRTADQPTAELLSPGSYFGASGASTHDLSCSASAECIVYIRAEGSFDVASTGR